MTRGRVRRRLGLVVALALTAALIVVAALLSAGPPGDAPLLDRLLGVLVATALLLLAALALPRSPGSAWPLVALAAAVAAYDAVAVARQLEPVASSRDWPLLALIALLSLLSAVAVASGYALRRRGATSLSERIVLALVIIGDMLAVAAAIWALGDAFSVGPRAIPTSADPIRIAIRIGLGVLVVGFAAGAARDLATPVGRALERQRSSPAPGSRLWQLLGFLADEVTPSRTARRTALVEAERARIAADLHATVLPELRRAAAAAASLDAPVAVQLDLRRALDDVEQLMHARQSIVLEEFGLVAALEWLAERTEERSALSVELELEGPLPDSADALDPAIARAAFRIALLALDNVVRHAGASVASVRLLARDGWLRLVVRDDGAAAALPRPDGRGLADMRAEVAATGGSIDVGAAAGWRIEARWRYAASIAAAPATTPTATTDGRAAPAT